MRCRHCGAEARLVLADLGTAPPSNAMVTPDALERAETWIPLRVRVCERCWLAQTEDFVAAGDVFDADYTYFSAYSKGWLAHAERYVARMTDRLGLGPDSLVVEVAANDGYLLQYVRARDIPCFGIEPTASTARAARERGIEVVEAFFGETLGRQLAAEGRMADLIAANNVLAHVPDINDFAAGFAPLLRPDGVATFEFHHLMRLVDGCQFDTIYHEHFSYLSLTAVTSILDRAGLSIFDVEELLTQGGSLRVFAQRRDTGRRKAEPAVERLLEAESVAGMRTASYYTGFQDRILRVKYDLLDFLLRAREEGRRVAGYGAAAKGNTLLNFAGIRSDLVEFVVDRNPAKQGRFLPGSRIPVLGEDELARRRPDLVLILPWNLREEIMVEQAGIAAWGGRFATAIPRLTVWP